MLHPEEKEEILQTQKLNILNRKHEMERVMLGMDYLKNLHALAEKHEAEEIALKMQEVK